MGRLEDGIIQAGAAIVVDRRGYIVGWNEGAEASLGYTADDVLGRACHHVLCGKKPDGELVCHPWCELSPPRPPIRSDDELILYPRAANRDLMRVVLSVFRVERDDTTRGWIVHFITSAQRLPAEPHAAWPSAPAWPPRRQPRKPKPPDTEQH